MNKYQHSLNKIGNMVTMNFLNIMERTHTKEEYKILQELVDKETPMKPIKNDKLCHNQFSDLCPTCRTTLLYKSAGCHNNECRQRIDWSEHNV